MRHLVVKSIFLMWLRLIWMAVTIRKIRLFHAVYSDSHYLLYVKK